MDSSANVVTSVEVTPVISEPAPVPVPVVVSEPVPVPVVVSEPTKPEPVVVPVVSQSTLDKNLEALFKAITTDSSFLARVKISVDKIMHDGKVDQYDIPEIVFVISETVNSLPSFQVTSEVVPVLIKMLYNFIVDTYKLVPEDKKADFERMVDSSLRLLMLQPKVKEGLNRCVGFFSSLSCCK